MKSKSTKKLFILFYLSWTIVFTIIPIIVVRQEKLTWGMIILAFILSAILSIPATYFFFKVLNKQTGRRMDISFDLLSEEKLIIKTNANLKRNIVLLDGFLFLTDKRILFLGTEFFDRNKMLMCLSLNIISDYEHINGSQLIIRDNFGKKYILLLNGGSKFLLELSNILS